MLTTYPISHPVEISQHLYMIISAKFQRAQGEKKTIFGRNWRIFNKNEFKEELEKSSWDNVTLPMYQTIILKSKPY